MESWSSYEESEIKRMYFTHTRKEIAAALGRSEGSVRTKCYRLRMNWKQSPDWSEDDLKYLRQYYKEREGKPLRLKELTVRFGRLRSNICRKARELGLSDLSRRKVHVRKTKVKKFATIEEARAEIGRKTRERLRNHHPRGMAGKTHTPEARAKISENNRRVQANITASQRIAINMKARRTRVANGKPYNPHGSWKAGWREVGGKSVYFRSRWEANYARYLEWLRSIGNIRDWEHEPETFWFEGVKRGCVSYLPDFRITNPNSTVEYHEVKGWMDDKSKTKIKRMRKYHPEVVLKVIDSKSYNKLAGQVKGFVPEWEYDTKNRA